jgi:cell wall-associated NlpC family hydrolase
VQHTVRSHRATPRVTKRFLAKLGLGAFVALGATAAVASPAHAAASAERPVALLWGNTHSVGQGGSVQLWAKLVHPGTESRINSLTTQLQVWTGGKWKTVITQRLGATGYNGFTLQPDMSRKYRLYFPGWNSNGHQVYSGAVSASWGFTMTAGPASNKANAVVAEARKHLGKWYSFGAAGPNRFDCSGLTQYVYSKVGVKLPHSAAGQRNVGRAVPASQARAGDLVVFREGGSWGHVGIYLGNGYMLDAPHTGSQVRVEKVWNDTVVYRRVV